MNEKSAPASEAPKPIRERFEFILTINGNIVCQRYFRINGFKRESTSSVDLLYAVNDCVEMIENDLKRKSSIYLWLTAPQVFKDADEANYYLSRHRINVPSFVVFRDDPDKTYVWNGEDAEEYTGFFRNDYISSADEQPSVLKFAFLDGGREIISRVFDCSFCPKFVRTNIDLSNSRNRYRNSDVFAPFEANLIDAMNNGGSDIIPQIVRKLCVCCSYDEKEDYDTSMAFGNRDADHNAVPGSDVVYEFCTERLNNKMFNRMEKSLRTKTRNYFYRGC